MRIDRPSAWVDRHCSELTPPARAAVARLLEATTLPGVDAPALARLRDREGRRLGPRQVKLVHDRIARWSERLRATDHLVQKGLTQEHAFDITQRFGPHVIALTERNPYLLAPAGVPFAVMDTLARHQGRTLDDHARLAAAVLTEFQAQTFGSGQTHVERKTVLEGASRLLARAGAVPSQHQMEAVLGAILTRPQLYTPAAYLDHGTLVKVGREAEGEAWRSLSVAREMTAYQNRLTHKRIWWSEVHIARGISRLLSGSPVKPDLSDGYFSEHVAKRPMDPEQIMATEEMWQAPVMILNGGPGTGKSYSVSLLLDSFHHCWAGAGRPRIVIMATTGLAAAKLHESTGHPVLTVHGALHMGPTGHTPFCADAGKPLRADLVIVEESSMLDEISARALFRAVATGARVVLVGDSNQLQSVGPGRVLADLIAGGVPTVTLRRNHRSGERKQIGDLAEQVLLGRLNADSLVKGPGISWRDCAPHEVQDVVVSEALEHLTRDESVLVLSPYRSQKRHPLAADALAKQISRRLRPGEGDYVVGDQVIQTRPLRLPDAGGWITIPNGLRGVVVEVRYDDFGNTEAVAVQYPGRTVWYDARDLRENLALAEALTVHKAQGQEVDTVVLPLAFHQIQIQGGGVRTYSLWRKTLLYTAITRARRQVILVGDPQAFIAGADRPEPLRWTSLKRLVERVYQERDLHVTPS